MDRIVFVYPKIEFQDNYPNSWIPYSLLALATSINKSNIEIFLFDQNKNNDKEFIKYIEKYKDEILCVAFSVMTGGAQIKNALYLSRIAKGQGIITAFGGPHVNVLPAQTAKHELVDYALKGLGQIQFPIFIDVLRHKKEVSIVPNIYYYKGQCLKTGVDKSFNGLYLPNYDFSFINVEPYIQNDNTINTRTINYITSQGCPYTCRFCYETCYKRKHYKIREADVIDDIEFLVRKYNVNGIKFYDADWFVDVDRSIRICDSLKKLNIKWAASINPRDVLRAERNNKKKLLQKAKDSGCTRLLMGMESGNNRVLNTIIDKRVTKEELYEVAQLISNYGILGSYTFIVGFPNETKEEIQETFDFIENLWDLNFCPETRVHIYTPYPGTKLFEDALDLGFKVPNTLEGWASFDYYKAMTPWTDIDLEQKVKEYTKMIEKRNKNI